MKLSNLFENEQREYVIIGNPGRSLSSSLWPKTEKAELYSKDEAKNICDKLNGPSIQVTYGAQPSSVHWHFKHITEAENYVMGKAKYAIQDLLWKKEDEDNF